jgi:hypothetical protein
VALVPDQQCSNYLIFNGLSSLHDVDADELGGIPHGGCDFVTLGEQGKDDTVSLMCNMAGQGYQKVHSLESNPEIINPRRFTEFGTFVLQTSAHVCREYACNVMKDKIAQDSCICADVLNKDDAKSGIANTGARACDAHAHVYMDETTGEMVADYIHTHATPSGETHEHAADGTKVTYVGGLGYQHETQCLTKEQIDDWKPDSCDEDDLNKAKSILDTCKNSENPVCSGHEAWATSNYSVAATEKGLGYCSLLKNSDLLDENSVELPEEGYYEPVFDADKNQITLKVSTCPDGTEFKQEKYDAFVTNTGYLKLQQHDEAPMGSMADKLYHSRLCGWAENLQSGETWGSNCEAVLVGDGTSAAVESIQYSYCQQMFFYKHRVTDHWDHELVYWINTQNYENAFKRIFPKKSISRESWWSDHETDEFCEPAPTVAPTVFNWTDVHKQPRFTWDVQKMSSHETDLTWDEWADPSRQVACDGACGWDLHCDPLDTSCCGAYFTEVSASENRKKEGCGGCCIIPVCGDLNSDEY